MDSDAIPLANLTMPEPAPESDSQIKNLLLIFVLFILVVSDFFVSNVITHLGEKTTVGRYPTPWGVVLQGISLVICYAALTHLSDSQLI